jgi:hypothetical protein
MGETTETTETTLFERHGWSVVRDSADGTYAILDEDGDAWDYRDALDEAIRVCREEGEERHREHLITLIQESDLTSFPTHMLATIATMLGHTVEG